MPKRHLMIIAGAGASFDSDYERVPAKTFRNGKEGMIDGYSDARIPLANDLFSSRFQGFRAKYPSVQPLASELNARAQGTSVEEFLGEYQKRAHRDTFVLSQLMAARFYIRDVIEDRERKWYLDERHNTNWMTLLSRLRSLLSMTEDLTIATTNYDRLIEDSLSRFPDGTYLDIPDYTREDKTNVLKLHGSVDWYKHDRFVQPGRDGDITPEWIIENAEKIGEGDDFFKTDTMRKKHVIEGRRLIPAIAIPVREKVDFMCPDTTLSRFTDRLTISTHLLVVGRRGEDKHIIRLIREHAKKIDHVTLVGRDAQGINTLAAHLGYLDGMHEFVNKCTAGFSGFVQGSKALDKMCDLLD